MFFSTRHMETLSIGSFSAAISEGKGVLVTPTVDGNLLVGPNAEEIKDKQDTATTCSGLSEILRTASLSVSLPSTGDIITSFAGLRRSRHRRFYHPSIGGQQTVHPCCGDRIPRLTAAPAIGERVVSCLKKVGLDWFKTNYNPSIKYGKAAAI